MTSIGASSRATRRDRASVRPAPARAALPLGYGLLIGAVVSMGLWAAIAVGLSALLA